MEDRELRRRLGFTAVPAFASILMALYPALAAISPDDVITAIEKAKILAPGIRVSVTQSKEAKEELNITTFRNVKAEDKDCKIEAVLMAKTAMDLDPTSVTRVQVYFYSSAMTGKYKKVTVTAGDVKAFGAGAMSQEQLLKSIDISEGDLNSSTQMSSYMQSSMPTLPENVVTAQKGDEMDITTNLDAAVSERDAKFEALQLAEMSLPALKSEVKKIKITFVDPSNPAGSREAVLNVAEVQALNDKVVTALAPLTVSDKAAAVSVQSVKVVDGPMKEQRQKILSDIQRLDKNGTDVTLLTQSFVSIEKLAVPGNEAALTDALTKLVKAVEDAQKK